MTYIGVILPILWIQLSNIVGPKICSIGFGVIVVVQRHYFVVSFYEHMTHAKNQVYHISIAKQSYDIVLLHIQKAITCRMFNKLIFLMNDQLNDLYNFNGLNN